MQSPHFEEWFAALGLLNAPQRKQVQQVLLPAAGLDQIIAGLDDCFESIPALRDSLLFFGATIRYAEFNSRDRPVADIRDASTAGPRVTRGSPRR